MKKIIILDFESGEVHVFNYDSNIFEDFSDFVIVINEEYDLMSSNCEHFVNEVLFDDFHSYDVDRLVSLTSAVRKNDHSSIHDLIFNDPFPYSSVYI